MSKSDNNISHTLKEYKINGQIHMVQYTFQNLPLCILNTLRRILLSEIPIIGLDLNEKESSIIENESPIHNEYLQLRIGLIPIHYRLLGDIFIDSKWNEEKNIREYKIKDAGDKKFKIKKDGSSKNSNLYKSDNTAIEITNNYVKKIEDLNISAPNDINNLKSYVMSNDKEVSTKDITLTVGRGIDDSRFSPISYFTWEFSDNSNFENERDYTLGNKYGTDPEKVVMKIKSNHMNPSDLFKHSNYILKEKLYDLLKHKIDNTDCVYYDDTKADHDSVVMIMKNENDTIGNIISQIGKYYLINEKKVVKMITYKITHPLENDIMIRFSLDNDPFILAKQMGISYTNTDDEERYRIYKLLTTMYLKDCIKYIFKTFFNIDGKDENDINQKIEDHLGNNKEYIHWI